MTKLHSKNRRAAWVVLLALVLGCLGARASLDLHYSLNGCLGSDSYQTLLDEARDQTVLYNKPFALHALGSPSLTLPCSYTRALPYLFGIGLAYFYAEKGGAKNTQKLNISRPVIALLWTATAATMMLCVYGTYGMRKPSGINVGECTWGNTQNFFYTVFSTVGWGLSITFIVFAGLFGYGGPVTKLLASGIFCPLSRLVYGAYLVHPMLMYSLYFSGNKQTDWFDYRVAMVGLELLHKLPCSRRGRTSSASRLLRSVWRWRAIC